MAIKWSEIEGWFGNGDAEFVSGVCRSLPEGAVVAEVGVFAGRCTAVMAPICMANGCEYHAVDNFRGSDPSDPATKAQRSRGIRGVFEENMKSLGLHGYISLHVSDSADAASMFQDDFVDFCFIDADHTPKGVRRDIVAWWPKIKSGGLLGGHDYPSSRASKANKLLGTTVDAFATSVGRRVEASRARRRRDRHSCWVIRK